MLVGEFREYSRRIVRELESLQIFRLLMKKSGGVQLNEMGLEFLSKAIERGHSQASVARILDVNPSVVSRHLKHGDC